MEEEYLLKKGYFYIIIRTYIRKYWKIYETSNVTNISAEMLEIAKFLIEVKKQRLGCD